MAAWDIFNKNRYKELENRFNSQLQEINNQKNLLINQQLQQRFNALARVMMASHVYPHHTIRRAVEIYSSNPAVKAVVSRSGKKFGSIPKYIYDNEGKKIVGEAKDLEKLLNRPNDSEGADVFFDSVYRWFKLTGEVFIFLNKGLTDDQRESLSDEEIFNLPTLEMRVLESHLIRLVPGATIFSVDAYEYNCDHKTWRRFTKNEICHWKSPSISCGYDVGSDEHLRGASPLRSGIKTVEMFELATDSLVNALKNGGARGTLSIEPNESFGPLTPEQSSDVRAVVDRDINNVKVAGSVAVFPDMKTHYESIGLSPVDLQILEGKEHALKELCMIFDYRYELLNTENVNYANGPAAQRDWVSSSIMPDIKQLDDELNRVLLPGFGLVDKVYIHSDPTALPEMKRDITVISNAMIQAKGYLTPNEQRIEMGWEPKTIEDDPYGDEREIDGMPLSVFIEQNDTVALQNEVLRERSNINPNDGQGDNTEA